MSAHGWREIHPSAVATRDKVSCPRLAKLLLARFGSKSGEIEVVSSHEEEVLGGADIRAGSVIWAGGRWFARAECSPTWWHFHFECTGEPLLAARKTYALKAVEARRRMVELQTGKELVPHSQLDDLILLIHQGMQGWVAEDGAGGSAAQRAYVLNRVRRGERDAWETEHWRAAAAGRVHVSGSQADSSSRWRQALTEMALCGCRLQQLGKEHCKERRAAFWERLGELRLLNKVFGAFRRSLLGAEVGRLAALRALRLARAHVEELDGMDGFARRRLRTAVGTQQLEIGEGRTLAVNQPGAWLLSRAWVAWRTVLAQGREKNGKRMADASCRGRGGTI